MAHSSLNDTAPKVNKSLQEVDLFLAKVAEEVHSPRMMRVIPLNQDPT